MEDTIQQILLSNTISVEENSRITCYYVAAIVIIDEDSIGRHSKQITELSTAFIDQPQTAIVFLAWRSFEKHWLFMAPHITYYHDYMYYTFKENTQGIERNPQCVSKPYQWLNSKSNNLRSIKWVPRTNNNIDCNSWNCNCYEK